MATIPLNLTSAPFAVRAVRHDPHTSTLWAVKDGRVRWDCLARNVDLGLLATLHIHESKVII
jgi:hypothetical protein